MVLNLSTGCVCGVRYVCPVGKKVTQEQADAEFAAAGLIPLTPYEGINVEREATCTRCGTWRRVTLRSVREPQSYACRWCHGWSHWGPWGEEARKIKLTWSPVRGADYSMEILTETGWIPLTPVGDEFTPIGCLCPTCGETFVTVPERFDSDRPDWFGCQRCATAATRAARSEGAAVYEKAGLRLLEPIRGRWTAYPAECLTCGSLRHVSYQDALYGTGPACWSCTFGILPNEPHRVYLFRFPELGVLKVGITHNRHDHRLVEHAVNGGILLQSVVVPTRADALAVEAWVLSQRSRWRSPNVGPAEFPQGGWTEAWEDLPETQVDLVHLCAQILPAFEPNSKSG